MSQSQHPTEPSRSASDTWLRRTIFEPLAKRTPKTVKPNSITALTPIFATISFGCAASAPHLEPWAGLVARIFAGVFMFGSMVTDYVDGIHARSTGQSSKLGEALDHWFDAFDVPLATFGLALTLQVPAPLAMALVAGSAMVYNAQLVVYHHTSKFIYPPFGGASAQFGLSLGYVAFGVVFLVLPREMLWVDVGVYAICAVTLFSMLQQIRFYMVHFDRAQGSGHFAFVLACAAFAILGGIGGLRGEIAMALMVLASLRISGRYVLRTVYPLPYNGYDTLMVGGGTALWLTATFAPLQTVLGHALTDLLGLSIVGVALLLCAADFLTTAGKLKLHTLHKAKAISAE